MAKRYYWLKLNKDFFDSIRIRKLRSIAGGDTYTIIYLKLLLYAIDTDGEIEYQGIEKTLGEELSFALSESAEDIGLCINYLRSVGLAEVKTDGIILPEAIEKVGSETASTQRWRDWKSRKNQQSLLESNTSPTDRQQIANVEKRREEKIREDTEIEKETDTEKEIEKSKSKRFTPPSVEEVRAYCFERGNKIKAEAFVDFYASKGWKVGKEPMKDWKAAVRTWERRHAEEDKQQKGGWTFSDL